jgi:hypothetical protein
MYSESNAFDNNFRLATGQARTLDLLVLSLAL